MLDGTSKYDPLNNYLCRQRGGELPLSFGEVEKVLGFALPPSARAHPAWWSNNRGTNVAVKSWRDAGWRTSRVDLAAERVTFVREGPQAERETKPPVAPRTPENGPGEIVIDRSQLRGSAIRLLQDYCEESGSDLAGAIVDILNKMALERRRQLLDRFPMHGPPSPIDSTDLIREDRDAR